VIYTDPPQLAPAALTGQRCTHCRLVLQVGYGSTPWGLGSYWDCPRCGRVFDFRADPEAYRQRAACPVCAEVLLTMTVQPAAAGHPLTGLVCPNGHPVDEIGRG